MESLLQKIYSNDEFIQMIDDLLNNDTVKQMKNFRQHYETSCFDHCLIASYYCYLYGKKFIKSTGGQQFNVINLQRKNKSIF